MTGPVGLADLISKERMVAFDNCMCGKSHFTAPARPTDLKFSFRAAEGLRVLK